MSRKLGSAGRTLTSFPCACAVTVPAIDIVRDRGGGRPDHNDDARLLQCGPDLLGIGSTALQLMIPAPYCASIMAASARVNSRCFEKQLMKICATLALPPNVCCARKTCPTICGKRVG